MWWHIDQKVRTPPIWLSVVSLNSLCTPLPKASQHERSATHITATRVKARVRAFVGRTPIVAQLYASGTIEEAACWAHARRKFYDVYKDQASPPSAPGVDELPFLDVHHPKHLARKGSDRVSNAVALCPNCHQL